MPSRTSLICLVSVILILVGVFYFSTVREGHNWGGDFSLYIHHAVNIVEGNPYEDTGYIYNPFDPYISPKVYPPIFPIILSVVYRNFGINLALMKYVIVIFFLLSLTVISINFQCELSLGQLALLLMIIGFNPYFWNFKESIISDIPFLFFVYTSIKFIDYTVINLVSTRLPLLTTLIVIATIMVTCATRAIGIILVPCLVAYEFIRFQKLRFHSVLLLLFITTMILGSCLLDSYTTYLNQVNIRFSGCMQNVLTYGKHATVLWSNSYNKPVTLLISVITILFAFIGLLSRRKHDLKFFDIFFLLYTCFIIIWPGSSKRFLIPIIPLYVFYFFKGIENAAFLRKDSARRWVLITLLIGILSSYISEYAIADFGPIKDGIHKKEAVELFHFIKNHTKEDDVFVFYKPRVLALFTRRRTSVYHETQSDREFFDYLHRIKATHIVEFRTLDRPFFTGFIQRNQKDFHVIFSNSDFKVFRLSQSNGSVLSYPSSNQYDSQ